MPREEVRVLAEGVLEALRELLEINVVLPDHVHRFQEHADILGAAFQLLPRARSGDDLDVREARLPAAPAYQQSGLYVGQYGELEVLKEVRLQEVKAVSVDGPDVHLGHPWQRSELGSNERGDAVLQLGRCLVGEREGDDA